MGRAGDGTQERDQERGSQEEEGPGQEDGRAYRQGASGVEEGKKLFETFLIFPRP